MKRLFVLVLSILTLLAPCVVCAQSLAIVPSNTSIQFKVRNLGIMNVTGSFNRFTGTLKLDQADITRSMVDVSIETASISTGIDRRDTHLRSDDFFDTARHPTMRFTSTALERLGPDRLKLTGNLTIRGVTRPVTLTVTAQPGEGGADFTRSATATATINRQEFGVSYGAVIGDSVQISITTRLKGH